MISNNIKSWRKFSLLGLSLALMNTSCIDYI